MFLWPDLYHPLLHGGGRSGQMVGAVDSRLRGPGLIPPGDIVLCCWARHFTITMLISPRHGYQQIMVGITLWCSSKRGGGGGVDIFLVTQFYRNQNEFCTNGPLGLKAEFGEYKQRRFWATHVNQKWVLFHFNALMLPKLLYLLRVFTIREAIC